jgi:sarcosine oxidase
MLALAESAATFGVGFQQGVAVPADDHLVVSGIPVRADLVVWAVGTALSKCFPGLASVRPVHLDNCYFTSRGDWQGTDCQPAWLDRAHGAYGIPDVGSGKVKIIIDRESGVDVGISTPPDDLARAARRYAAARLPALRDSALVQRERCWYATTPDEHFVLAPHPNHDRVWLLGGDSGHGFKHGPAWGSYVADAIEGYTPVEPYFRLR